MFGLFFGNKRTGDKEKKVQHVPRSTPEHPAYVIVDKQGEAIPMKKIGKDEYEMIIFTP